MADLLRARQKDWLGGMNSATADDSLALNEARELVNINLTIRPNSLEQISGPELFTSIDGVAEAAGILVETIFRFYQSDGTAFTMVSWTNGGTRKVGHFTALSLTTLTLTTPLANVITDWVSFQDRVYFVNGDTKLYRWDGVAAGFTEVTFPISFKPKSMEMFKARAYYAGDAADPTRFIFSLPLTPDLFDSPFLDFVDIAGADGDVIEDLKLLGRDLIILAQRSIHRVIGSPPQDVHGIEEIGVGCINRKTARKTNLGIVFLSPFGIHLYQGGERTILLSRKIDFEIKTKISLAANNFSSIFHKGVYYFFYRRGDGTNIDEGYSFALNALDLQTGEIGISRMKNFQLLENTVFDGANDSQQWLGVQGGTNNILRVDTTNKTTFYQNVANPTVVLTSETKTRWEDMGNESLVKELRTLFVFAHKRQTDVDLELLTELRGVFRTTALKLTTNIISAQWNNVNWNQFNWGPSGTSYYEIRLPAGIYCNKACIRFKSENSADFFTMDSLEYHYLPMREV